ncbi:MAG TPA: glycine cleavage T C-terminal barrel domain-containing protein [Vicinamibacteria bacterium]
MAFEREYRAAMEGALALDRSHLATVAARGKDRESFLQNMLSNDVRSLAPFTGIPAAFLTNKGKLVSDLLVFKCEDAFLLQMERERAEPFRKALDRYIISEDVVLESLAETEATFSLEGPKASGILAELAGIPSAELDGLAHLHFRLLAPGEWKARVVAQRRELTPRFDVSADPKAAKRLLEDVLERGALLGGEEVREARRIEASRPRFGVDMDESHLPLEAGLDEAISFHKGCYIGQEYVVRLAHRGHVNRKLSGLKVAGNAPPAPGTPVMRGPEEAGAVTSSAFSPAFGCPLALAYLKRGHWEPGTEVTVAGAAATVSSLPFTLPH